MTARPLCHAEILGRDTTVPRALRWKSCKKPAVWKARIPSHRPGGPAVVYYCERHQHHIGDPKCTSATRHSMERLAVNR